MEIISEFKRRIEKISILAIILVFICSLLLGGSAYATGSNEIRGYGYRTKEFKTDINVKKDNTMEVTENITVIFDAPHHGFFRRIPISQKENTIKDIEVEGEDFSVRTNSRGDDIFYVIQIGKSGKELTGEHSYKIKYRIENFNDTNSRADFLVANLIPPEWETGIQHAEGTLKLPKPVSWGKAELVCGSYGGREYPISKYDVFVESGEKSIHVEADNMPDCCGLTVRSTLPEGYWVGGKKYRSPGFFASIYFMIAAIISVVLWFFFGRDPGTGRIVTAFPPEKMTPAEAGYFLTGAADEKSFASMIMWFAEKGYIKITEQREGGYKLTKIKDMPKNEKLFAKKFFNSVFSEGRTSVITNEMYSGFKEDFVIAKSFLKYEGDNGYRKTVYYKSSRIAKIISTLVIAFAEILTAVAIYKEGGIASSNLAAGCGIALAGTYFTMHSYNLLAEKWDSVGTARKAVSFAIGTVGAVLFSVFMYKMSAELFGTKTYGKFMVVGFLVAVVANVFMKSRRVESARLKGQISGFRFFMKKAEEEELMELVAENAGYFYEIMPYAYVMRRTKKWVGKFVEYDIEKPAPEWYDTENVRKAENPETYMIMLDEIRKNLKTALDFRWQL